MPKDLLAGRTPATAPFIERRICVIRGQKVMLDSDLAEIYQVPTKALNQAVKRNPDRFPADFMFQLSRDEFENWRSQIATSNPGARMGIRRPPYAFTEHGVAMLSSVLNSARAIRMSILIVRAFVKLRGLPTANKDLAARSNPLKNNKLTHRSSKPDLCSSTPRSWSRFGIAPFADAIECNPHDLLLRTRQADGSRTGPARAALPTHQRPDPHGDRHGILLCLRRGAPQLRGHQLLPFLRPGAVARSVESGEKEAGVAGRPSGSSKADNSPASSSIKSASGSDSSGIGTTVIRKSTSAI